MKKAAIIMMVSTSILLAEVFVDTSTRLMWQDVPYTDAEAKAYSGDTDDNKVGDWEYAKRYCSDLMLDGYGDWRLPNRMELLSITDKTKYDPAIISGFKHTTSGGYWSSSPSVSGASYAWGVNFKDGRDSHNAKSGSLYVRCVRDSE